MSGCSDSDSAPLSSPDTGLPSGQPPAAQTCVVPNASAGTKADGDEQGARANACFNPELFMANGQLNLEYVQKKGLSRDAEDVSSLGVQTDVRYRNCDAAKTYGQVDTTSLASGETQSASVAFYDVANESNLTVFRLGTQSESAPNGYTLVSETTYEPYLEMRFDLAEGDSFARSYSSKTVATLSGLSDGGGGSNTSSTQSQVQEIVSFMGTESIVLEAGVFDACHFNLETTRTVDDGEPTTHYSSQWFDVGSGVLLKVEDAGQVKELTDGLVNGRSLD
ncbi:MAG: hypothetical protein ACSHXK_04205 [Oceanococcus sp.]